MSPEARGGKGSPLSAIAWRFRDEDETHSIILDRSDTRTRRLLEAFLPAYEGADVVTGHWVQGFDLPVLSHELQDNQMRSLEQKLTSTSSDSRPGPTGPEGNPWSGLRSE